MPRALISVYDKTDIVHFSKKLVEMGWEIISTGGTAKTLKDEGVNIIEVEEVTNYPECLGGRVKTLHPKIHGGILARREIEEDLKQLEKMEIETIDMVVNTLYPFKETVLKEDASHEEIVENIDIGGPSMIRAAAKNYKDVLIITDIADYNSILLELENEKTVSLETRKYLAAKAFQITANYECMISQYFNKLNNIDIPNYLNLTYELREEMRYGENPHQKGQLYVEAHKKINSIVNSEQKQGKALSFNNIADGDAAIEILKEFTQLPTVVAVKHANPCGIGSGNTLLEAFEKAYAADSVSIFGGIIACSHMVEKETAELMNSIFLEVIIAPNYTDEALKVLSKKKNLRVLKLPSIMEESASEFALKKVEGGILKQDVNSLLFEGELEVVTEKKPTKEEMEDLIFAWKAVKHVKSNAIVIARENRTIAVGPGQVSRIWALENAIKQGGDCVNGAVLASDAFFPFDDCVELAGKNGIKAIIQPGGSINDKDSIKKANEMGIAMVFTGIRHFKH